MLEYLPHISVFTAAHVALVVVTLYCVLLTKKEPTAAVAWCLAVLLFPVGGAVLFWIFGYNYVHRRVRSKREHRARFRARHPPPTPEAARGADAGPTPADDLGRLALKANAFPVTHGNAVVLYHDTHAAFEALLDGVRRARHHVHLEFFILHKDATGRRLLDLLGQKAKEGVEVRLLVDGVGSLRLGRRPLRELRQAGGRAAVFLRLGSLRSLWHVNLRNHRKIAVLDGRAAFTGGMNVGDEYLGRSAYFGYWRDTFLRVEGPAVAGLQRVFTEDWDFAAGEALNGDAYFPDVPTAGDAAVQVAESGPDQAVNCIRELYFMAILGARRRLWIASPYLVPDGGLLDALRLACYRQVDVRLLTLSRPDHYVSYYAGRYYWPELAALGVRVYLYQKGMMHTKLMLADDRWAMVGSANLDNRSLRLNFEAGCALHTPALVADLAAAFERDLADAAPFDAAAFARRSRAVRVVENACRLLSPAL